MNIKDYYKDIDSILRDCEVAFLVDGADYAERDIDVMINKIKQRFLKHNSIDLNKGKLRDLAGQPGVVGGAVRVYIDNLASIHARVCALCQIFRYTADCPIDISETNYLGFTPDTMKTFLQAMQREALEQRVGDSIEALKEKMAIINVSSVKRFVVIMILAYEFGVNEISAAIAEILYLGGYK